MDVKAKEVDQKSQSKLVCVTPLEYTFLVVTCKKQTVSHTCCGVQCTV